MPFRTEIFCAILPITSATRLIATFPDPMAMCKCCAMVFR